MEQYFVNGLCWGSLYAIVALGFALVLNSLRTLHLAHGAVFAAAGLTSWYTHTVLTCPAAVSLVIAIIVGVGLSVVIDRAIYEPIRTRYGRQTGLDTLIVGSLGADAALRGLMGLAWGSDSRTLVLGEGAAMHVGQATFSLAQTFQLLAFVLTAVVIVSAVRTPLGRVARALADDSDLLGVVGYDVRAMRLYAMSVAGGLAGMAGFLAAADFGVSPRSGFEVVLIAAVTSSLSGSRWIVGPLVGAMMVGQIQAWSGSLLSSKWTPVLVYTVLMALLMVRPRGLLSLSSRADSA